MHARKQYLILICAAALAAHLSAHADNGLYNGSGGSFSAPTTVGSNITEQGVPATGTNASVSFACPITFFGAGTYQWNWNCTGGSVTISSTDNSVSMSGVFSSGTMTYSGSGPGEGHPTYFYEFAGTFTGTVTRGTVSEVVEGSVTTSVETSGTASSGPVTSQAMGWSSAYSPVLVVDTVNQRLEKADDLAGHHPIQYGTWGSGAGQFTAIAGLAQDSTGSIYITDSSLNRVVRIANLTGTGWVTLGSAGSGSLNFNHPTGIAVDAMRRIWVADSGNNRIVRFDSMTGTNWTAFGSSGSGAGEFSSPSAIAFDAHGRIYVADTGNNRLVRMDDLNGTNWTTLNSINLSPYAYNLTSVNSVALNAAGQIYVTSGSWLYRVDDMTGANAQVSEWTGVIAGISLDRTGTLFATGSFTPSVASAVNGLGAGYYSGTLGQSSLQAGAILALHSPSPPPAAPLLSRTLIAFPSRNVGEPGAAESLSVTNIGGEPLTVSSVTATPDYQLTNGCSAPVPAGSSCTIEAAFDPTATGLRLATLTVNSNGVHPRLNATLRGIGTMPQPVVLPSAALSFQPQPTGTTSGAETVTLANTGTGPLTLASIVAAGDFAETNHCPGVVAPGNGCTIAVTFTPTALSTRRGSLTISDDAIPSGTVQVVTLSGTGVSGTPAVTLTPGSLLFPNQQLNVASAPQTLILKNNTTAAIALGAPSISAGITGSTTCGSSVAGGATCSFSVQFMPTSAGTKAGSLSITPAGKSPVAAGLAGTGVVSGTADLVASPLSLAFGAWQVGDHPSMTVTLTNRTGLPTGVRSVVVSGSTAFALGSTTCSGVVAGGGSCTVQVTMMPTVSGSFTGSVTVTESSGATVGVKLTGSATVNGG